MNLGTILQAMLSAIRPTRLDALTMHVTPTVPPVVSVGFVDSTGATRYTTLGEGIGGDAPTDGQFVYYHVDSGDMPVAEWRPTSVVSYAEVSPDNRLLLIEPAATEKVTIRVPGDTSGEWIPEVFLGLGSNGQTKGIRLWAEGSGGYDAEFAVNAADPAQEIQSSIGFSANMVSIFAEDSVNISGIRHVGTKTVAQLNAMPIEIEPGFAWANDGRALTAGAWPTVEGPGVGTGALVQRASTSAVWCLAGTAIAVQA